MFYDARGRNLHSQATPQPPVLLPLSAVFSDWARVCGGLGSQAIPNPSIKIGNPISSRWWGFRNLHCWMSWPLWLPVGWFAGSDLCATGHNHVNPKHRTYVRERNAQSQTLLPWPRFRNSFGLQRVAARIAIIFPFYLFYLLSLRLFFIVFLLESATATGMPCTRHELGKLTATVAPWPRDKFFSFFFCCLPAYLPALCCWWVIRHHITYCAPTPKPPTQLSDCTCSIRKEERREWKDWKDKMCLSVSFKTHYPRPGTRTNWPLFRVRWIGLPPPSSPKRLKKNKKTTGVMESDMVVFIGRQFVVHPHYFFWKACCLFHPPTNLIKSNERLCFNRNGNGWGAGWDWSIEYEMLTRRYG